MYFEDIDYTTEQEKRIACDLSGCTIDKLNGRIPIIKYAYRYNNDLLRKTFDRDFVAVMSFMFPTWDKKEWDSVFEPVRYLQIDKRDEKWCICGHWIKHCCIWKNKNTGTSVLVGNVCIKKISANAYRDMLSCVKKQNDKKQSQLKIQWDNYNSKIKHYHIKRELQLNKERDELVSRIEQKHDEYIIRELQLNKERDELVSRIEQEHDEYIIRELFRACKTCFCYRIAKDEPSWKINCFTCHNNKK